MPQPLLRCLCVFSVFATIAAQSSNAVEPTTATRPLYACKVNVADLPEYDGYPTPDMQAAQLGLNGMLAGLLDQWNIDTDGFPVGRARASTHQGQRHQQQQQQQSKQTGSSAPAGQGSAPVSQPPAAPPPAPPNYIIPRPAGPLASGKSVGIAVAGQAAAAEELLGIDAGLEGAAPAAAAAAAAGGMEGMAAPAPDAPIALQVETLGSADMATAVVAAGELAVMLPPHSTPAATQDGTVGGPDTDASPRRKLSQLSAKSVCNKGTYTSSTSAPPGKATFTDVQGTLGLTMQATNVVPADAAIAVGPREVVHVVNSLLRIMPIGNSGGLASSSRPGKSRTIPLPDFFGLVASPCDGGYINPSAAYDKAVGRFLLAAVCAGDANQVLLAASANSSAMGSWALYSFAGEVTQSTPMQCANGSYPLSLHTQLGYNQDGIFISFVQNCPTNLDTATGAVLFALPKWAVYKGATYFWAPVWTAWDVYNAAGGGQNAQLYPGAFLQLQPVLPQRPADVQAEVAYFVSDNLNYVNPLQRTQMTIAALINTGSLWLYEGPSSSSPAPLLVARVISRDVLCLALPTTLLVQPAAGDPAADIPAMNCTPLAAGAMLPPGFWSGGAALYANQVYLADRGPDLLDALGNFQPTIYWAVLTPSFCVSGPCAPWFGSDWGWDDGWDWRTGSWAADSDRGRTPYSDPSFYNQVFLFPSQATNSGRRLQQHPADSWGSRDKPARSSLSLRRQLMALLSKPGLQGSSSLQPLRDGAGVPLPPSFDGTETLTAAALYARLGPVRHDRLVAGIREALDRTEALRPSSTRSTQRRLTQAGAEPAENGTPNIRRRQSAAANATLPAPSGTVSAQNLFLGGGYAFNGWSGWAAGDSPTYFDYYQYWREYFFLRNLYMALRIPPKVNPCKYYKDWADDNTITFGAIVSRKGVLDFASPPQANPVGLAFPQVAVRGGSMLIVYSFSGPFGLPDGQGGVLAYPGVGYSVIPGSQANGPAQFRLAKAGAGCVEQGGSTAWGSYSGIDVQHPSYKIWSAVEYAWTQTDWVSVSNAGTWLSVFN